ncbi:MAG: Ribosomal large subunit methyltransferase RlmJ, partial [Pseudomonadota bacterium]
MGSHLIVLNPPFGLQSACEEVLPWLVTQLGLNISNIIDLIGSRGFLALLIFVVGSLLIGFLLGGPGSGDSYGTARELMR